jgi:hypothetical protein
VDQCVTQQQSNPIDKIGEPDRLIRVLADFNAERSLFRFLGASPTNLNITHCHWSPNGYVLVVRRIRVAEDPIRGDYDQCWKF